MKATVDLGKVAVNPGTSIRILRFHIDGTLKWEPLRRATAKKNMKSQRRALTVMAGESRYKKSGKCMGQ